MLPQLKLLEILLRLQSLTRRKRKVDMPHKNYSKKQKKLASVASPKNKITGADFKALKKKPKAKNGKGRSR